jgi:divalent metal cation (Fe/Co/Zn/Cd) transporter
MRSADLLDGFKNGNIPEIELSIGFYFILGGGTVAKVLLWQLRRRATPSSDSLDALAEDHLNDVASTIAAIATAVLAAKVPSIWWIDGIGAILISCWIVSRWFSVTKQQSHKLIGKSGKYMLASSLKKKKKAAWHSMHSTYTQTYTFTMCMLQTHDTS